MKFRLLLHGDEIAEAALPTEEMRRIVGEHGAFSRRLADSGALVRGEALTPSKQGRTVRVRDRRVTDGPFAETREQLGGFYVIEAPDLEAATRLAEGVPDSPGLVVEIRPIADM